MEIILKAVEKHEEDILHNLVQYYIYEFSQYNARFEVEQDGKYKPFYLKEYFSSPDSYAYFLKVDGQYAGFALFSYDSINGYNMDEFFVMRKYTGKGVGRNAAWQIFDQFRGQWHITQIEKNYPAQAFWRNIIKSYTSDNFEEKYDKNHCSIQQFDNSNGL